MKQCVHHQAPAVGTAALFAPILFVVVLATTIRSTEGFTVLPSVSSSSYFTTSTIQPSPRLQQQQQQQHRLWVVADAQGEDIRKRKRRNHTGDGSEEEEDIVFNDNEVEEQGEKEDDWIPTESGGFLPNLGRRLNFFARRRRRNQEQAAFEETAADGVAETQPIDTPPQVAPSQLPRKAAPAVDPHVHDVLTILDYKRIVVDQTDATWVVVRFFAPWCKACKAVEASYRRLAREYSQSHQGAVTFVQVPVTEENAFLSQGLGVPSLPYVHVYHVEAGLVQEQSLNKKYFKDFTTTLKQYVQGSCDLPKDDDDDEIEETTTTPTRTTTMERQQGVQQNYLERKEQEKKEKIQQEVDDDDDTDPDEESGIFFDDDSIALES